jgi:hypothetical protein
VFSSVVLVVSLLASAPAPEASPADIEPAFSNTIVSTYPDGRKARLWLNPDGAYRAQGQRGDHSSGRWSLRADKLCLKQKKPMSIPFAYCTQVRRGGIGTSWMGRAVTGERIRIQLVAGR